MLFDRYPPGVDGFLRQHWQREPLLIRQALPDFEPPLDADDIAGLACDPLAESRLVTGTHDARNWSVRYGPFAETDFAGLQETGWTLLVQDVEEQYPPLRSLLDEFDFIPGWRLDDLMVSVAGPGGSVGPHVDQYDVFLLQASGRRRWQIAHSFEPELLPDCDLQVLREFVPQQEWVLDAGDMLYLPAGVAHFGIALDEGMTWSIGMRAPSAADLFQALGEWLAGRRDQGGRYRDPDHAAITLAGEIGAPAIDQFRKLLETTLRDDGDFSAFLGQFLSRYRLAHEPAPPEESLSTARLEAALAEGQRLRHNPWTRFAWVRQDDQALLFAAGASHRCDADLARRVCDRRELARLGTGAGDEALRLLCRLYNEGHLYLEGQA
jgi:50S ribosomal protein L16 3-hydroxylase